MESAATSLTPAPLSAHEGAARAPLTFREGPDGFPTVDWEYWKSINGDIVGWVTVPGTPIDYPIVQARPDDPDFYLTHDLYGHYNLYGCPYVDSACRGLFEGSHTIVYGHHMSSGKMFAAFSSYSEREFADNHPYVYVQSPIEQRIYEVQAADIIEGTAAIKRTAFSDYSDFADYYAQRLTDSDMRRFSTTEATSCLTFCTCSYHFTPENERTLVYTKPLPATDERLAQSFASG